MDTAILLCMLNLGFLAALPRVFFRPGRLTLGWWLTASPFLVTGFTLLGGALGVIAPAELPGPRAIPELLRNVATILAAASIALIGFTVGTHRRPVAMWHQRDDDADHLVTHGAYARIRHPFYASFILMLTACAAAFPHLLTALAAVAGFLRLDRTAAREERRLLRSSLGAEYADYMHRTGRFAPVVRSR